MTTQRTCWNELTRVQMPALVHLTRIGYTYFGKISEDDRHTVYDPDTNILINVFKTQFAKLNPDKAGEAEETLRTLRLELDFDDLGESFYNRLRAVSPVKLIDFEHPENNVYHCTAEFTCKRDEEEFRPDITLFINGLPLVFIEVKRPNNRGGMTAEAARMNNLRFPNSKFRRFINITQLMIFSNNMEYAAQSNGITPVEGVFYCTGAKQRAAFNCFWEENSLNKPIAPYNQEYPYKDIDPILEKRILADFNNHSLYCVSEYHTNLDVNTPTNRVITSMCSPERLLFLIKYGITYYHKTREKPDGSLEQINQKHIMRYQQFFAAMTVRQKMAQGCKSGIIWHTQGSGKTALSYHLSYVLSDYFASINKVAKFYFIVDRLDLLKQAKEEFEARGLIVKTANSREELMSQFLTNQSQEGVTGKPEITVVNIQRFDEKPGNVVLPNYATNLQRIFIIDEAHRGYKPEGSFLAHLFDADPNSIKIALTGTPLLKEERESWRVFGNYLHTYYYDKSVRDGYTLKIIREDIETQYKERLSEVYRSLEVLVQKKDITKEQILEHETFVRELLRYIISDLKQFRFLHGDDTLGGMVICQSSEQARMLNKLFEEIQNELNETSVNKSHFSAGLILCDEGDKEFRSDVISDFKDNFKIDILIVFNMLLTGFDAPRLKRLYFGRKLKDHSLLQAITRVNRPYKDNRFGYIIDFADIKQNFEQANEAYLRELNKFNNPDEVGEGNEIDILSQVMEKPEELINRVKTATQTLFEFPMKNAEEFSQTISQIEDKDALYKIQKALIEIRDCCNIVQTFGDDELKEQFSSFKNVPLKNLISEVQRRIAFLNQREALVDNSTSLIVNEAMWGITFNFSKVGEEELRISDDGVELNEKLRRVIVKLTENVDQEDPEYITLLRAFRERFKECGFTVENVSVYRSHLKFLDEIIKKLNDIQRKNDALLRAYNSDVKFVRIHKRIRERNADRISAGKAPIISTFDAQIVQTLRAIKRRIDQRVFDRNDIINNEGYFDGIVMQEISGGMKELHVNSDRDDRRFIQVRIINQYKEQNRPTDAAW